jgi:hypothetical protein
MYNITNYHATSLSLLCCDLRAPNLDAYRPYMPGRRIRGGCTLTRVPEFPPIRDITSSGIDGGPCCALLYLDYCCDCTMLQRVLTRIYAPILPISTCLQPPGQTIKYGDAQSIPEVWWRSVTPAHTNGPIAFRIVWAWQLYRPLQ